MPLRFDIKRKLSARSDRVKALDVHDSEPWLLVALYSGHLNIWNYETQTIVKTIEATSNDLPIRTARFIERKSWVVCGSDDMVIRVYNYNTMDKVHSFEAHADYIRCISVHPTQSFILTSSDDMMIKLWDWNKNWACTQTFEGHTHYVMQVVFNPKDTNTFASASLDKTIRVWQMGSTQPNFTLVGHEKGVNCLDYYRGADKPYLISGADDFVAKIWDYQNKSCVQTLVGHTQNVTSVCFHADMPIIITGSEDGTIRLWHVNTYRLEFTLNYGFERVWCVAQLPGSNTLSIGYDEGAIMIKLGREQPAITMDNQGKIIWAKHSEIQQANVKALGDSPHKDGEILPLAVKDLGSCEIFPQTLLHNPNGRFVVVCGDGEYIIYTALAWRNKSFGTAEEFVWSADSSMYAIREGNSRVKIFKNFKEVQDFKPDYGVDGIYGGQLLGVKSGSGLTFYNWETTALVRRIEVAPQQVYWSDNGELVCIATEDEAFMLRYNPDVIEGTPPDEDGFEAAFDVVGEVADKVMTGVWVGDCFIYTNSENRLNYHVGGEIVTISHLDRTQYILGYIAKDSKLYLGDKDLNVTSFALKTAVLEYQTAVMRQDFETADQILPSIDEEHRTRVAQFLEKQGFKEQAMAVSVDPAHKFELALQLNDFATAYGLAVEHSSEQRWKQLSDLALRSSDFNLAKKCMFNAKDYSGLLLLASSLGDSESMVQLAELAHSAGKENIAFTAYMMLNNIPKCLQLLVETERYPEAAIMAKTYMPSEVSKILKLWQADLSKTNEKAAEALADPLQYDNLFPELQLALKAEKLLEKERSTLLPAASYPAVAPNWERDVLAETEEMLASLPEVAASPKEDEMLTAEVKEEQPVSEPEQEEKEDLFEEAPEDLGGVVNAPEPIIALEPEPSSPSSEPPMPPIELEPEPVLQEVPADLAEKVPEPIIALEPEPSSLPSEPPMFPVEPELEPAVQEVPLNLVELAPEPFAEVVPEPPMEFAPEPFVEFAPEPPAKIVPEPIAEVVSEPIVEVAPEPLIELAPEPLVELAPEPLIELAPEPLIELAPEPLVEMVPEPIVEATPEPLIELAPEPFIEFTPEPLPEMVPEPLVDVAPEPPVEEVLVPAPAETPAEAVEEASEKRDLFGNSSTDFLDDMDREISELNLDDINVDDIDLDDESLFD